MKKFFKDNLVIIIIVFIFLIAISLGIYFVISNVEKSQKEIEKKVEEVDNKYVLFSNDSSTISTMRSKIYTEVFNNVYYVDFSTKNESWVNNFNEYYNLINKFYGDYKDVINICNNYNFVYDSTKQKCESMLEYYEVMINNYVTDCNLYNQNIEKYNTWVDSNTSYSKLESYVSSGFLEYVDYNNNGEVEYY